METMTEVGAPGLKREGLEGWLDTHAQERLAPEEAIRFFDSCSAVSTESIRGQWHGFSLRTGHPFDGLLESFGWYGKVFLGGEEVHPLIFRGGPDGLYSLNANLIPRALLPFAPRVGRAEWLKTVFRAAGTALGTTKPSARLRMMEHRGVVTATMVYDALPIQDVYRRVDEGTLLGWMDLRGMSKPYLFVLRKDRSPGILFEKLKGAAKGG